MKAAEKPRRYEIIPVRMVLSGIPIPAPGPLPDGPSEESDACQWPDELAITGVFTRPTCPERARQQAEELLRHCRERLRRGDRSAIPELLDLNPEFISVRRVREEFLRLLEGGAPPSEARPPVGSVQEEPAVRSRTR